MKNILSLCINLLLLMISDAVPLKLIAGDRSVVKKDGATHTISKYYVVPNDYDPNNVTNTTAATQKASLRMHSLYAKTLDSGSQGGQEDVTYQPYDTTESTVSMSTEQTLDSDDLGNLQVVPIINPINISHIVTDDEIDTNVNSGEAVQNGSAFIVDNVTDYQNIEDAIHDLILSKFGIAVRDIYSQNLESFWKLIKIKIDKELGDDELLATIQQISVLLNIFTHLYEAAQIQQPVEKMIDGIVEILQKPFVEKSNRDESQAETNISGNYDEECLRKCGQRSSNPPLDSNSTETEASDDLELDNLQRRQVGLDDNDVIKMSDDPDSNQVTVSNEPTNVARSQLVVPYNLNVGVPDGHNVLSSMTTPTLNDVARYIDIQEGLNSIQNIPDSTENVENLDDQPVNVESKFADVLPLTIKSRTTDDLPWTYEDKTTEYFPWPTTTSNDGLPWHIEDKTSGHKIPWNTESRTAWTIQNKIRHLPVTTWYQSSDPSVTTHGGNILLNPNQSIKSTVHFIKTGIKKPYHIYTYVINPTGTLHKVPNAGNVVQVISKKPYENLKTTLYGLPNLHGGNKVVYKNQPPQSHYELQYKLSKPTNDISRPPSYSQVTHHVTKTYDQSHEVNPSTLHLQTTQEAIEPQNLVGHGSEPNHKPALLQSNTHPSESQPNSGEEKEAPTVPEIPRNVNPDIDDQNPYDNGNRIQPSSYPALVNTAHSSVQTNQYPGLISASASSSIDTNGLDEPVYGSQVYKQPGAISTASANSKYTIVQNDNFVPTQVHGGDTNHYPGYIDEPVYGGQINQQPGAISTASANSKYTIVQNDNFVPTQVHGGDTNHYPGYIDEPVYGGQKNQQPGAISIVSANSKYTIVQNDNDVPTQVHGGDTNNYPGNPISKATAHSEYTNVPIDYGHDTDTQHPVYPNVVDDFDESIPVNGVQIQKYPGSIAKDNYLVPYQPHGHTVHIIHQPSLIETVSGNQNLKLAATYRLFTLQNLENLENAIIKTIQMHRPGFYDDRALINLKNIINVILLLAENLEKTDGTNTWYEKIFYNSESSQHPLQHYVYNLIRQRWLHELMLVLVKNNFSINILQNPGIFSFLESWKFPKYVQDFMEAEELTHEPNPPNYNDISNNQNDLQHKFSIHTSDDLLEVPINLAKYVTKNVIDSYKTPNEGIVLSIAGVEAEPDANAIVNILQNYLHDKNYIETQENVIIRDNKIEMLKQIILFLREKGYGPTTIAELIRKLYTAVYSTEGRGCKTNHTNFAKNMYDVILPVLRSSGR